MGIPIETGPRTFVTLTIGLFCNLCIPHCKEICVAYDPTIWSPDYNNTIARGRFSRLPWTTPILWKTRVVMWMPTLSALVAPQIVNMTTCWVWVSRLPPTTHILWIKSCRNTNFAFTSGNNNVRCHQWFKVGIMTTLGFQCKETHTFLWYIYAIISFSKVLSVDNL